MRLATIGDQADLEKLFKEVSLGNIRPGVVRSAIEMSQAATNGNADLENGGNFCFVTEEITDAGRAVVGSARLQMGLHGDWRPVSRSIQFNGKTVIQRYLEFTIDEKKEVEFAGNVVLKDHHRAGHGRLNTGGRMLYFALFRNLIEQISGPIDGLYANILTEERIDGFELFNELVKGLVGGMSYDLVDHLRFQYRMSSESPIYRSLLQGLKIPMHLIRTELGVICNASKPAKALLEKHGFEEAERFDALDGGRYMELSSEKFDLTFQYRKYRARYESADNFFSRKSRLYTVATCERSMSEFLAARIPIIFDGTDVVLPKSVFSHLEIQRDERLAIIA